MLLSRKFLITTEHNNRKPAAVSINSNREVAEAEEKQSLLLIASSLFSEKSTDIGRSQLQFAYK